MLDKQTALIIGTAIEDEDTGLNSPLRFRSGLLGAFATRLDQDRRAQLVNALIEVASAASNDDIWADLAPLLTGEALDRVFDTLMSIRDYRLSRILAAIAPTLSPSQLSQAFEVVVSTYAQPSIHDPLSTLAPYLTEALVERVLTIAFTLTDSSCAQLLAALGPKLTPALQARVLDTVFAPLTDEDIEAYEQKQLELKEPISHKVALGVVSHFYKGRQRSNVRALAPHLNADSLKHVLNFVSAEDNVRYLTDNLISLAPYLQGEALDRAVSFAQNLTPDLNRILALAAVAPRCEPELRAQLLEYALNLTRELPPNKDRLYGDPYSINESDRVRALLALAPHLDGRLADYALVMGLRIDYLDDRSRVAAALAPRISDESVGWLIDSAIKMSSFYREGRMAAVLVALAPRLTGDEMTKAFEAVLRIKDYQGSPYPYALAKFAPYLTGDLLFRGIEAPLNFSDSNARRNVMTGLLPQVIKEVEAHGVQPDLEAALDKVPDLDRVRLYLALASALPDDSRDPYYQHAAQIATSMVTKYKFDYARILLLVLPTGALDEAWLPTIQATLETVFAQNVLLSAAFNWLFDHPNS